MVVRFANKTGGSFSYTDVADNYWAKQAINTASAYGWIRGAGDGTFRPGQEITRAEAATVLNRVLLRAADRKYAAEHSDELTLFSDLWDNRRWYFYGMLEATNAHNCRREGELEVWDTIG